MTDTQSLIVSELYFSGYLRCTKAVVIDQQSK